MDNKNEKLYEIINQFKDSKFAQEVNETLLEIEKTKPGELSAILAKLKEVLKEQGSK